MEKNIIIQESFIAGKIFTLRDECIILDVHLAELYNVETRVLKQAVKRNIDRFPNDFLFVLSDIEIQQVVSQNVIPSKCNFGGANPFAFTENGVAMLSSILKSKKAIEVNIAIMRTFTTLRKSILINKDIIREIDKIKNELTEQDEKILIIFEYLKKFEQKSKLIEEQENRVKIGFKK